MTAYSAKLEQLQRSLSAGGAAGIGLSKKTSNLFRNRGEAARPRVDLTGFNEVIRVNPSAGLVEAEGMTTYADVVAATLPHGVMPCVVPELKSITIGGAAVGVGIESSSFKYGLVHETVLGLDVLLADGTIVTCTADNEHRDLFFGFPNSYGTLGYALKVTARTVPVKRYVKLEHIRHRDARAYFEDLESRCAGDADFLDGTVFATDSLFITEGRFVDEAPYTSDYGFERIYYRSIRERREDYLSPPDYIWRWDTDWFWCSRNVFAQNPVIRRLYGRRRLNSVTYSAIMRWNSRWGVTRMLSRLAGKHSEAVIQDVDIPVSRAAEFLKFLLAEVGILPIWICPVRAYDPAAVFPLYPLDPHTLYVNFGFWDVVRRPEPRPGGFYNRAIERRVLELGGIKSLYSDSYFPADEFWSVYGRDCYQQLKARYDPEGAFKDLYQKCVLKERGSNR